MRVPIIAGNWKMNTTVAEAVSLVGEIASAAAAGSAECVVCPPFTALAAATAAAQDTAVRVGAQDMFWRESGAYTGQIAPRMLLDLGVTHVIFGHSERRGRFGVPEEGFTPEVLAHFGDTDATVNLKLHAALKHGLIPIVCCGETLAERQARNTDAIVESQLERGLAGLSSEQAAGIVIAYEPVWAIGTGETCAAAEAQRVCAVIRSTVTRLQGPAAGQAVRVQYGGSVKPDNARELLSQPDIDGALVGGASLKAADFLAILAAAG